MSAAWNPSRWLNVPRGSFKPAPGVLVCPHLKLVRPVTGAHEFDVWVADQLILQIEVAVKFAPQEGDGSSPAVASARPDAPAEVHRFLRQARCAAKIGDPHLVQVLEQGKVKGGIPFIVMELLEGMSLSQRLLSGPLALSEARAVLNQAAGVLAKAHALGLWHGSVCPEHLFASETAGELFLKIANFGDVASDTWATDPASGLAPDAPSRKQGYLAPEQLQQGTGSSAAADLWALGVTLYELLTTTLPFEAATSADISVAICNAQFSPPSRYRADLPPAVDAWFARVFAPQQGARMLDANELAREFARALGLQPPEAPGFVAQSFVEAGREQHDEELAGDGFEEGDERTVRWDAPSEREPGSAQGDAALPAHSPDAERISARPASGPPPLPDRPPSSRPPPPFPGYAPTLAFPAASAVVPAAFLGTLPGRSPAGPILGSPITGSPIIGSPATPGVAGLAYRRSATPVAVTAPSAEARVFAGRYRLTKAHGLIAGTLLGGIGALLLAWGIQGSRDGGEGASEANVSAETRTAPLGSAESAVARPRTAGSASSRSSARPSENLVILQTDELPRAPDETADEEESGNAESGTTGSAGSRSAGSHRAGAAKFDPKSSSGGSTTAANAANAANARLDPGSTAAHAATKPRATAATPRRDTSHRSAKRGNANADCNPPYFFDNNNIRRLKLECL